MDDLERSSSLLMTKLPRSYTARDEAFTALFIDVTDTWVVGHGPQMAEFAKTKEGMIRCKVGIVLMCNEHGESLRWEVILGKQQDRKSISQMIDSVKGLSWLGNSPVICERSMGNTAQARQLLGAGMRFLICGVLTECWHRLGMMPRKDNE